MPLPTDALPTPARRPVLLLVHGALGAAAQLTPLIDALAPDADVHLVELPGHGHTPLPDGRPFTMHTFADAIADAARAVTPTGGDAPCCFGYSMGGYAALWLAANVPDALRSIVTVGTKFDWTPEGAAQAAARLDADQLRAKVPAFAAALAERHAEAGGWETMLARTAELLTGLGQRPLLTRESLARVAIPVRLLVGSRDDTVSAEETARYAALLPHGEAIPLDNVPHPIEKVPPALLAEMIRPLLRS